MAHQRVLRRDDAARRDGPEEIARREAVDRGTAPAQQIDVGIPEEEAEKTVEGGGGEASPEGEGGGFPGLFRIARSVGTGDDPHGPDAEEVGDSREDHKGRHADRRRRDHGVCAILADKEGIRHVVKHKDHLTDDGGQGQMRHRLPDWGR